MPELRNVPKQELSPEELANLPDLCEYVGRSNDLKYLLGKLIPTARVQELVPVGERENIIVTLPDGTRSHPWKYIWIWTAGPDGLPVTRYQPLPPETGEPKMATGDLTAVGLTDATLDQLAQELLGVRWEPDRPGPSAARKRMYDAVMAKAYG